MRHSIQPVPARRKPRPLARIVAGIVVLVVVAPLLVESSGTRAEQASSASPLIADGLLDAGDDHTCVIRDGGVQCWGEDNNGRLGEGNPVNANIGDDEAPGPFGQVELGDDPLAPTAIAGGTNHTCVLIEEALRCWGDGPDGRLGYGNTARIGDDEPPRAVGPVEVGAGRTVNAVATGNEHTCAILDNDALRCWGQGGNGRLGYGNVTTIGDNETPGSVGTVNLGAGRTAKAVAAGRLHTCAILDNNRVRCWGADANGALGDGNPASDSIGDDEVPGSEPTVDLGSGRTAKAITAGSLHTCAILDTGAVRCWGEDDSGALGDGNPANDNIGDDEVPGSEPTVDLGSGRTAKAISAGAHHTCAILDNDAVKCWGDGSRGRLGYANTTTIGDDEQPSSVGTVDLGAGRTAKAIAGGGEHTCAVLDTDAVRCWGEDDAGAIGDGNTTNDNFGDDETPGSEAPVDLGSGRTANVLTSGGFHACAILDDDTVRCWGADTFGAIGSGDPAVDHIGDDETPGSEPVVGVPRGDATAVSAGAEHTCALMDTGIVRCWGRDNFGQLGNGASSTQDIGDDEEPGSAPAVDLGPGRTAIAITAGASHTCAILDTGDVQCWGAGAQGRLGYGNVANVGDDEPLGSVGPVYLGPGRTAKAITAGVVHTCAILDDDAVLCWGEDDDGALGDGNPANDNIGDDELPGFQPVVNVGAGRTAKALAASPHHTCAILDDDSVRCWGRGSNGGELGYGNTTRIGDDEAPGSVGPVDLGAGRTATAITVGGQFFGALHSCAILDDATVRCWGLGNVGQLGYGNTNTIGDDETPGSVGVVNVGPSSPIALSAGGAHSCALFSHKRSVRCWGEDNSGALGDANPSNDNIGDDETPASVDVVDLFDRRTADVALEVAVSTTSVATGDRHTCAILLDDTVRCWGANPDGRLGYGHTTTIGDDESPTDAGPIDLGPGRTAKALTANGSHTCAILDDDTVRCWGEDDGGRLGDANPANDNIGDDETPGSVGPVDLGAGRTAKAIDAGEAHTCAILDNDTVRCWGLDGVFFIFGFLDSGVLGDGDPAFDAVGDDETPGSRPTVDLGAGRTAKAITSGSHHNCAILDNDAVRCWGTGTSGRLGYGNGATVGDDETPGSVGTVDVGPGRSAKTIAAGGGGFFGSGHTCAILDNDDLRCWGEDDNGELGDANPADDNIGDDETPGSEPPVDLGSPHTAEMIAAGHHHTCAILSNVSVRCWGSNPDGRLGYGHTANIGDNETPASAGPVPVDVENAPDGIWTGGAHTCAVIDPSRALRCWGEGNDGRLGDADPRANDVGNDEPASAGRLVGQGPDFDDFDALPLLGTTGSLILTNGWASSEDGEPSNTSTTDARHSLWFRWQAPANSNVSFDTCTTRFDSNIAAYTGSTLGSLTKIASNDDGCASGLGSRITFAAAAGTTYRISIDSQDVAKGPFALTWSSPAGFALNVSTAGSGTVTGERIDCGTDCFDVYADGKKVTLTAAPAPGHTFAGWSGACTGSSTTCTVTMTAARSVTATFADLGLGCTILGTGASDVLVGTSGADVMCGFGGNDYLKAGDGADVLLPGPGNDHVEGGGSSGDVLSFVDSAGPVSVDLAAKTASGDGTDQLTGVESVIGTDAADTLVGNSSRNTLRGGLGDDILRGGGGDDTLLPGPGAMPEIDGGTGSDVLSFTDLTSSGASVDLSSTADAIVGVEHLTGSEQVDTFTGDGGANALSGMGGNDSLSGGSGNDTLLPGTGADPLLDGGSGNDLLSYAGQSGAVSVDLASMTDPVTGIEHLTGGNGADTLSGDGNANTLIGGGGGDTLSGAGGDDVLQPGTGTDTLDGGTGSDVVTYIDITSAGVVVNLAAGTATGGGGSDGLTSIERARGTAGNDTLIGTDAANLLTGFGGNDVLQAAGGADELRPGTGNDTTVDGGSGTDIVVYDDITTGGVEVDLGAGTTGLAAGSDGLSSIERVRGTNQDDDLTGSSATNTLFGLDGADTLNVLDSNAGDTADGGNGTDDCTADPGDTVLNCP